MNHYLAALVEVFSILDAIRLYYSALSRNHFQDRTEKKS